MINKKEIIKKIVSIHTKYTQKEIGEVLDTFLNIIMDEVASGNKVSIAGFGIFESKIRAARIGHIPITNEPIDLPEKKVPGFRALKTFKEKVEK